MEERDFFDEKVENKQHTMVCPHCNQEGQFTLVWTVRRKRKEMPRGGDELNLILPGRNYGWPDASNGISS